MGKDKEKPVYSEHWGEPKLDKKELEKENEKFLGEGTNAEQKMILYNKVMRIEKMVYFLIGEVAVLYIIIILNYFLN